jgi:hypothetical protein
MGLTSRIQARSDPQGNASGTSRGLPLRANHQIPRSGREDNSVEGRSFASRAYWELTQSRAARNCSVSRSEMFRPCDEDCSSAPGSLISSGKRQLLAETCPA